MYRKLIFFIVVLLLVSASSGWAQDPNLVGYWKLDGDATDSSGNAQHGVLYGDLYSWVDGIIGQGLDLAPNGGSDPNNSYIFVDDANGNAAIEFSTESFSIALWLKTTSSEIGSETRILINGINEGDATGIRYEIKGGSTATGDEAQFSVDDGVTKGEVRGDSVATGEWEHCVCVFDAADQRLRIFNNGRLRDTTSNFPTGDISTPNVPLLIGCEDDITHFYSGLLDDIRI